jgi:hypothetical protein
MHLPLQRWLPHRMEAHTGTHRGRRVPIRGSEGCNVTSAHGTIPDRDGDPPRPDPFQRRFYDPALGYMQWKHGRVLEDADHARRCVYAS